MPRVTWTGRTRAPWGTHTRLGAFSSLAALNRGLDSVRALDPLAFLAVPRNSATTCSCRGDPTQRGVGDEQDILAFPHNKRDVRGQIREQFAAGIIGINFHGIGDHILRHGGVEPYFAYLSGKDIAGLRIYREGDRLARFDPADIRFID